MAYKKKKPKPRPKKAPKATNPYAPPEVVNKFAAAAKAIEGLDLGPKKRDSEMDLRGVGERVGRATK